MPDHAVSADPAVQAQLDRLWALSPGADVLGLDRISRLLARLGDPHHNLPPVFHVAGTNGKGSTCAFLRTAIEASGARVHVYSSPHLVRFNERIRLAGRLIEDAALAALLSEVLDHADGIGASFFEVTTAAAFLAFAHTPAEACVIEVGLGGRLDATNVLARPAATGIAALGIDHESFLGTTLESIAAEKAAIAKPGVPLVTMAYALPIAAIVGDVAARAGTSVLAQGAAWSYAPRSGQLEYNDTLGNLEIPVPALAGEYQAGNLALAVAMLRHQQAIPVDPSAYVAAATATRWPARMQRLSPGPLVDRLGAGATVWLDGAHNPSAAAPVAAAFRALAGDRLRHLVVGLLANKDAPGVLALLADSDTHVHAVPVPGHDHHAPDDLVRLARSCGAAASLAHDVAAAVDQIARQAAPGSAVLIAGSLYLAGEVLRANNQVPG